MYRCEKDSFAKWFLDSGSIAKYFAQASLLPTRIRGPRGAARRGAGRGKHSAALEYRGGRQKQRLLDCSMAPGAAWQVASGKCQLIRGIHYGWSRHSLRHAFLCQYKVLFSSFRNSSRKNTRDRSSIGKLTSLVEYTIRIKRQIMRSIGMQRVYVCKVLFVRGCVFQTSSSVLSSFSKKRENREKTGENTMVFLLAIRVTVFFLFIVDLDRQVAAANTVTSAKVLERFPSIFIPFIPHINWKRERLELF